MDSPLVITDEVSINYPPLHLGGVIFLEEEKSNTVFLLLGKNLGEAENQQTKNNRPGYYKKKPA